MPAAKANYIILYKNHSQPYACASKDIALNTPLPVGIKKEDKKILFITFEPDNNMLVAYPIPDEEVQAIELETKKRADKKKK